MNRQGSFSGYRVRGLVTRSMVTVSLLLVPACAMSPHSVSHPVSSNFVIEVERGANVPPGRISMKPVSGGLTGRAADVELYRSRAGVERLLISSEALAEDIAAHAAIIRSDGANPGELANPRNLRVARIATFYNATPAEPGCSNFRTGLRAGRPGRAILVYVDRAGSLRGWRLTSPYLVEYDLVFPRPGIYAVETRGRAGRLVQRTVDVGPMVAQVERTGCADEDARQVSR